MIGIDGQPSGPPYETADLTKSTAYRLVRVLHEESYLTHNDSGGSVIGRSLMGLATAVMPRADLYASARPVLRELADLSPETATLHMRAGDEAVLVLGAESDFEVDEAHKDGVLVQRGACARQYDVVRLERTGVVQHSLGCVSESDLSTLAPSGFGSSSATTVRRRADRPIADHLRESATAFSPFGSRLKE
ncbi:hypothetical protein ACFXC8_37910 [Streptomyces sp. NPDC059441]|uniref:hypothetical protein n=1 Tax=Streptomyces sp. NPDC059441 TaxID=3346829 RepID=UPI0036A2594D